MGIIMKATEYGTCVYCGNHAEMTDEHVVPRCLFPESLPPDIPMVTVGACSPCNSGKSHDDTYLRDFLLSDMATSRNPVARALRGGKLMRSVKKNRSEIARIVVNQARRKPLYSPGGIYLGSHYATPLQTNRLESSFGKMVRGLYYYASKTHLPQDIVLDVSRIDRFRIRAAWDEMATKGAATNVIHPEVFACRHFVDMHFPVFSRWQLLFYNTNLIEVLTLPSNWMEHVTSEEAINPASGLIRPDSVSGMLEGTS
jgi:hypothetical protein